MGNVAHTVVMLEEEGEKEHMVAQQKQGEDAVVVIHDLVEHF